MRGWKLVISAVLLSVLAAFVATYINESSCQATLKMLADGAMARAIGRANRAYLTQPPVVARWELEHAVQILESGDIAVYVDPDTVKRHRFCVTARLAKTCQNLNLQAEYEKWLGTAIASAPPFYPQATNAQTVMDTLAGIDSAIIASDGRDGERAAPGEREK